MTVEECCANPYLADEAWLYQRSVVDGLTAQEIAQQAGAAFQDTRRALMTAGIPHRIRDYYASTLGKRLTADTILTAVRQSASIEQAAEALQVNPITLRKHAEHKGLTWEAVKAAIGVGLEPTRDMLAEAADEMTTPELSAHFGITVKRTRQLLAQHGLKARPNPFSMRASEVEEAVRRYEVDGESINVIAEALGYGPSGIYRALKRRGVATSWRRVIKSTRTPEPSRPLVAPVTQPRHEPPPGVRPSEHLMNQMGVSVRAANALARAGVQDATDLAKWGVGDIADLRYVGPSITREITEACARLGIELQAGLTGAPTMTPLPARHKRDVLADELGIPNRYANRLVEIGVNEAKDLASWSRQELLDMPLIGERAVRLIEHAAARMGVTLKPDPPERPPVRHECRKFNPDRECLEELARVLSAQQIADRFGVTPPTVYKRLHEYGIALRWHVRTPRPKPPKPQRDPAVPSGRRVKVACRGCETYVWRDRAVAAQGPSWCSKACRERNEAS